MKKIQKLLPYFLFSLIALACLFQMFTVLNDYGRFWRRPLARMWNLTSFERSAYFFLHEDGAAFYKFIIKTVPPGKDIVVVQVNEMRYSSQNIFQFYIPNRGITVCSEDEEQLRACLAEPQNYIPFVEDFPPKDMVANKILIPYDGQNDLLRGIYVPPDHAAEPKPLAPASVEYLSLLPLFLDPLIWVALFVLGMLLVSLIFPQPDQFDTLALSLPISIGAFTVVLFLLSWAGIPLTVSTILLEYGCLVALLLWILWKKNRLHSLKKQAVQLIPNPRAIKKDWGNSLIWLSGFLLFSIAVVISIGRGYSLFDDIVIWSLKGYQMADYHTIMRAGVTSGHGLAYPLNISLVASIFRLFDGDMLPGSKLLFPLLTAALLLGIYRFWIQRNVSARLASLGLLVLISVPVIYIHSTIGFANLPFTAYLVLGILESINGLEQNRLSSLVAGGVLLGFAGWTRPEGIGFALAAAAALLLFHGLRRTSYSKILPWLAGIIAIPAIWLAFGSHYMNNDQIGRALRVFTASVQSGTVPTDNLIRIIQFGYEQFSNVKTWGVLFPLIIVLLLIAIPFTLYLRKRETFLLIPAVLVTFLAPLVLFYVESFDEVDFETFLSVSFDRALLPAAFMLAVFAILSTSALFQPGTELAERQP